MVQRKAQPMPRTPTCRGALLAVITLLLAAASAVAEQPATPYPAAQADNPLRQINRTRPAFATGFWGNVPLKWAVYDLHERKTVAAGDQHDVRFAGQVQVNYMIEVIRSDPG